MSRSVDSDALEIERRYQEEAHRRFLALIDHIRPELHRYCSRMVGSALDGEDLVQETLATAYYKLALLREGVPLQAWLFRIAHNKCIDSMRKQRDPVESLDSIEASVAVSVDPVENKEKTAAALKRLLHELAPMERACLLLKDVFGYSLQETSEIVDTTVGSVKTALHRGRTKLRSPVRSSPPSRRTHSDHSDLLALYADRFNRQDWSGLQELIGADARLETVDYFVAEGQNAISQRYFSQYAKMEPPPRLTVGHVDGEEVLLCWKRTGDGRDKWSPQAAIRIDWSEGKIRQIRDYYHVDYVLQGAEVQTASGEAPTP